MDSTLSLLGLALRAGRLAVGEEPIRALSHAHRVYLMLLAADAAENTVRRAARFCQEGKTIRLTLPYTRAELGEALGRGSCAVIACGDTGFAAAITEKLAKADPERYGAVRESLKQRDERARHRKAKKQRQSPGTPSGCVETKRRPAEDAHGPQQS